MAWTDMTQLTNCYAWYKSESLSSAYADGDPIDSWSDSSGNGRDISNTLTARPTALANAFGTYMAADFDGVNDYLESASYTQSGDIVVTLVVRFDVLKSYHGIYGFDANSPPTWNAGSPNTQWNTALGYNTGMLNLAHVNGIYNYMTTANRPSSYYSVATDYVMSFSIGGSGFQLNINGTTASIYSASISSSLSTPAAGTAYIALGCNGYFLDGKIAEFVAYDPVSSYLPEVSWVEGYLADKYSITLADGHLFKNEPPANAPTTYNPSGGGGSTFHPLG